MNDEDDKDDDDDDVGDFNNPNNNLQITDAGNFDSFLSLLVVLLLSPFSKDTVEPRGGVVVGCCGGCDMVPGM
jgi:hypothetical protein